MPDRTLDPLALETVVATRAPAKLNLFLELLARRDDGFHEIDTVMIPIDWFDDIQVRRTRDDIRLNVRWEPSSEAIASELGIADGGEDFDRLMRIPDDESNLVHRALSRFRQVFATEGGFQVELAKRIPAGAGMGGASSDAASALRCAATLWGIPTNTPELATIAADIGSDVPFFLGLQGEKPIAAARATGRGEILSEVVVGAELALVVVFPAISLSTAKVYSLAQVPTSPENPRRFLDRLEQGQNVGLATDMMNRLSEPAKKLAPRIGEILESLWRLGLQACQLTGSGSACFAIASSSKQAIELSNQARTELHPGAIVRNARSTTVPAPIDIMPTGET